MAPPTVFVALAVLCLATILSVIGLVTMDWEISESALGVAINSTEYEGREIVVYRKGLWQECISPAAPVSEADGICSKVFRKNVSFSIQMVRITYTFGVLYCILSVVLVILWLFGQSCQRSTCWRHLTFFFMAQAVFLCIMAIIAFGLVGAIDNAKRKLWSFGWSYLVSVVGAVILPLATFLACQYAHHLDDVEGTMLDRQRKNIEDYNTMEGDSYM